MVAVNDGLPPFRNYIDVPYSQRDGTNEITRIFLSSPSQEEIDGTEALKNRLGQSLSVIGALMPHMPAGIHITPALCDYCSQKGFNESFSKDLARLAILGIQGHRSPYRTLSERLASFRYAVDFLASYVQQPSLTAFADINKDFWLVFAEACEKDPRTTGKKNFQRIRGFFAQYPPTALGGWLTKLRTSTQNYVPAPEHTSDLADGGYSDAVLYQILALCLEGFHRRIGYLKRYETLTEADMPLDWLYPGRNNYKPVHGAKPYKVKKGEKRETEMFVLISTWLNDEENGYQILIDHFIMHHKAGLIRNEKNGNLGGIANSLKGFQAANKLRPEIKVFYETVAQSHGFTYKQGTNTSLLRFYLKKKTADKTNIVIDQIGWCLANLFMIQTGVNKEVALSIPSLGEDGRSILLRTNTLFVSNGGEATEAELYGFKARSGNHIFKVIPISIPMNSPLYEMLLDYERFVKVDRTGGPFFEFSKQFAQTWSNAGSLTDFTKIYPILDDEGKPLNSVQTPKFRKVFATGQLLDRINGIRDANDLAAKLREDLNHKNLDTTLKHYLLKTSVGRSVIDMAVATITSEKLAEALRFKGKIALVGGAPVKKQVFLCDCEDPTSPSHDVAIARECKHYDLCLGCERSVVTAFHLPYICLRILQYEEERRRAPQIWPATFEDRWMIANDALDRYVAKDIRNGQRLVDEAWSAARNGRISLPPIINSNRM